MAFPILPVASLALNAFSALSAKKGQEEANRAEMEFNAQEAQKQRDWEERMFGSRYQMTRKDLEAARLNPLLAFAGQPPAVSGVAASAHPKSTRSEMALIASGTAKQLADIDLATAHKNLLDEETGSARARRRIDEQMADVATSPPGKIAMAFDYYVEKFGVKEALRIIGGIFGAGAVARAIKGSRGTTPMSGKIRFERMSRSSSGRSQTREYEYFD